MKVRKCLPFDLCTANGLETCEIEVGGTGAGGYPLEEYGLRTGPGCPMTPCPAPPPSEVAAADTAATCELCPCSCWETNVTKSAKPPSCPFSPK